VDGGVLRVEGGESGGGVLRVEGGESGWWSVEGGGRREWMVEC